MKKLKDKPLTKGQRMARLHRRIENIAVKLEEIVTLVDNVNWELHEIQKMPDKEKKVQKISP